MCVSGEELERGIEVKLLRQGPSLAARENPKAINPSPRLGSDRFEVGMSQAWGEEADPL